MNIKKGCLFAFAAMAAVMLVCFCSGLGYGMYLLDEALDGRKPQATSVSSKDEWDLEAEMIQSQALARVGGWLSMVPMEQVTVQSPRGTLSADLYDPVGVGRDSVWAIVFHGGLGSDRKQVLDVACELSLAGYRVLTPDLYAHGRSNGDIASLGLADAQDVKAWVDMIREWEPDSQVVLIGYDEGAVAVFTAAAEGFSDQVAAIVMDSAWIEYEQQALSWLMTMRPDAGWVEQKWYFLAYEMNHGVQLSKIDAQELGKAIEVPALFYHGTGDERVLAWQSEDAAAFCANAKLCLIEGAPHAKARFIEPETYYRELFAFLDEALER